MLVKKEGDVMTTNERHNASVVKAIHRHFLLVAICCFVQSLTLINHFIRHNNLVLSWRIFAGGINLLPNFINL